MIADNNTSDNQENPKDADVAIVFRGEVRGENSEMIPYSDHSDWFNIACIRDALAKVDLDNIAPHEINPSPTSNYYNKRTAALKMVTANYCDVSRYTFEGNEVGWEYRISPRKWGYKTSIRPSGNIEAIWNEHGALCLAHTRLFSASHRINFPQKALPKNCQKDGSCLDEPSVRNELWAECKISKQSCDYETQGYFRSRSP
jgi:hypothetical protein